MMEPYLYLLIVTIGLLLSYKYFVIAKAFCSMKQRDPCILAYITSYMFGMSLSGAFSYSLYRHYILGYSYKPWIVATIVLLGVVPFIIYNVHIEER